MHQQPQGNQYQFRPPLLTFTYVLCWAGVSVYLLHIGRFFPWAIGGAFVTGGLGVAQIVHFFDDVSQLIAYRRRKRAYRNAAKHYGQTSFGDVDDARNAGLIGKGRR